MEGDQRASKGEVRADTNGHSLGLLKKEARQAYCRDDPRVLDDSMG